MSRRSRLIPVFAVAMLLAACAQDSDTPLAPSGPSFDENGVLIGGNQPGSQQDGTTAPGGTTATTDTTSRGVLIGGN